MYFIVLNLKFIIWKSYTLIKVHLKIWNIIIFKSHSKQCIFKSLILVIYLFKGGALTVASLNEIDLLVVKSDLMISYQTLICIVYKHFNSF